MTEYRFLFALLSLFLCALTGCTPALRNSPLPGGFALSKIAKVDAGAPFAVSRSGAVAAMTKGTLRIIDLSGGAGRSIAPAPATGICFSPGGARLAAAFAAKSGSLLQIFDLRGKVVAEAVIPGRVTSIAWRSEKELLATALEMKTYSFGSDLTALFYRWDGTTPPVATTLNRQTVRPFVARLPEQTLFGTLSMAVSPYGDEIAYSSLKDPPLFAPFLRIAVRHIDTGVEREVTQSPVGSGEPLYAPDGESLLVGNIVGGSRRLSLPGGGEIETWTVPADHAAFSPSGSYLFLEGRLFQGGREIAWLPDAAGVFLPDGSGLAIRQGKTLSLVTGLNDAQRPAALGNPGRILELRRLRMLGLITEKEFQTQKEKVPAR